MKISFSILKFLKHNNTLYDKSYAGAKKNFVEGRHKKFAGCKGQILTT